MKRQNEILKKFMDHCFKYGFNKKQNTITVHAPQFQEMVEDLTDDLSYAVRMDSFEKMREVIEVVCKEKSSESIELRLKDALFTALISRRQVFEVGDEDDEICEISDENTDAIENLRDVANPS